MCGTAGLLVTLLQREGSLAFKCQN